MSFVDASSAAGLGQVFAVDNDDDIAPGAANIEIAQVAEATGTLVKQVDVAGTDRFTIASSAVATGPGGDARLFKSR